MGMEFELRCGSCGYSLSVSVGVGMMHPHVCESALENMKKGAYGPEFRDDALNTPNAAVNTERVLYRCTTCNALTNDILLELCAPIGKPQPRTGIFSSACRGTGMNYVMGSDIGKTYRVIRGKLHICGTCGRLMVPASTSDKLPCPRCGHELTGTPGLCWD